MPNKTIEKKVADYLEKFVEPTIPGSLGAIQVDRIRLWLRPSLREVYEAGRLQGLNEALGVDLEDWPEEDADYWVGFRECIKQYRGKIKSLIDKK